MLAQMESESPIIGSLTEASGISVITKELKEVSISGLPKDLENVDQHSFVENNSIKCDNNPEEIESVDESSSVAVTEGVKEMCATEDLPAVNNICEGPSISADVFAQEDQSIDKTLAEEAFNNIDSPPDVRMTTEESFGDGASVPITEGSKGTRYMSSCSSNILSGLEGCTVHIKNMHGVVICNHDTKKGLSLKKCKVKDPDHLAYENDKVGANKLLNLVCSDIDIHQKINGICLEFEFPLPEPACITVDEHYNYLYEHWAQYLAKTKLTRYQFLSKVSKVADVSHLADK